MLMQKLLSALIVLSASLPAHAGPCDKLSLDLDKGTLNGVKLIASLAEVKKAFPCPSTASVVQKLTSLYFGQHSFNFIPGRSISVYSGGDDSFPGTLSKDILGKNAFEVSELLGEAAHYSREVADKEMGYYFGYEFYPRPWGTLIVKYDYHQPASVEEVILTVQKLAELKKLYK